MDEARTAGDRRHRSAAPRNREDSAACIDRAVELIREQYEVGEASAFTILVQASVDGRASVRETAWRIVGSADEG
jgi:AmiR/NasT family two-component response regulator